jgi:hypothetical protein
MMRPVSESVNETQMSLGAARWLLVTIIMLVPAVGCSPSPASLPSPSSPPTSASKPPLDYVALEAEIEKAITTGPATLETFVPCWSVLTARRRSPTTGTA